jgi:hypothetical protein
LGEAGFGLFEAEAREPAQRGALEALRLRMPDGDTDSEGVGELDAWQLAGRVADEGEVACLEGPMEAGVRRSLARHERMFAYLPSAAAPAPAQGRSLQMSGLSR